MRHNYLLALAACCLALASSAEDKLGCTLSQWSADEEFTLAGGQITQLFTPCQTGILEYVTISAQSATEESFAVRMKLFEVENGKMKLIHQQQGLIPREEQTTHTVFTLTRDIDVTDERQYFMQLDVPSDRQTKFQYSSQDEYREGELSVNHAKFRGDLAFEVGVNPKEVYSMKEMRAPDVMRDWVITSDIPEVQCSISQPKYNGIEKLYGGSYSQTFKACYSGLLEAIWFQGDLLESETSVPVYVFERKSGDFVGASELNQHPEERHTLVAGFMGVELKADTEYECFIDCSEDQKLEMRVVRNDGFFIGEFKHMHTVQDANLSFVAYLNESIETTETSDTWTTDTPHQGVALIGNPAQAGSSSAHWSSQVVAIQPAPNNAGVNVGFQQDLTGEVTVALYNMLGQVIEERLLTNPIAGTSLQFPTAGTHDQEYYQLRVLRDKTLIVDETFRH